jgi:hypothetical protein
VLCKACVQVGSLSVASVLLGKPHAFGWCLCEGFSSRIQKAWTNYLKWNELVPFAIGHHVLGCFPLHSWHSVQVQFIVYGRMLISDMVQGLINILCVSTSKTRYAPCYLKDKTILTVRISLGHKCQYWAVSFTVLPVDGLLTIGLWILVLDQVVLYGLAMFLDNMWYS